MTILLGLGVQFLSCVEDTTSRQISSWSVWLLNSFHHPSSIIFPKTWLLGSVVYRLFYLRRIWSPLHKAGTQTTERTVLPCSSKLDFTPECLRFLCQLTRTPATFPNCRGWITSPNWRALSSIAIQSILLASGPLAEAVNVSWKLEMKALQSLEADAEEPQALYSQMCSCSREQQETHQT